VAVWLWLGFHAAPARAHAIGLSRGDYQLRADGLELELAFARPDLLAALPALDEDRDGSLDASELARGSAALARFMLDGWTVARDGRACLGSVQTAELSEADGLCARVSFACRASAAPTRVELGFLRSMSRGHRHHAQLSNGLRSSEAIHFGPGARFELGPFEATEPSAPAASLPRERLGYLRMGVEHILGGADHIAFLVALMLGTARPLRMLRVVTAFTISHSLSLALVALEWFTPSTRWVEPLIALSVAYVGVENLRAAQPRHRELVSFGFGLVHGLGFGGALRDIRLTPSEIPSALALFNGGVELAQLSLIFALWPLLVRMRRASWFTRRALPACSLSLVACGLLWFATRLT
jgi:hydrogenase/urease accessory protein HupE